MERIDGRKALRELYAPPRRPVIVDVPELGYLALDGAGPPDSSDTFQSAIGTLYGLAYTLKFLPRKRPELDWPSWTVMPLEGLWSTGGENGQPAAGASEGEPRAHDPCWSWTLLICVPEVVSTKHVEEAKEELRGKGRDSPELDGARLERLAEGLCVQIMHLGPYDQESPTIARMHEFAYSQGYELHGRHHEIYLGDPHRTAPERLKTVLRHPVRPAG